MRRQVRKEENEIANQIRTKQHIDIIFTKIVFFIKIIFVTNLTPQHFLFETYLNALRNIEQVVGHQFM